MVQAEQGRGYRLSQPTELLDHELVCDALDDASRDRLESLEVLWQTSSTSDYLMQQPAASPGHSRVCLAEFQTDGRGRRGRSWFAAAGHGICLSLSWSFATSPQQLSCLGLAAGIGVLRAARAAGATQAQLKWPNDVVVAGQKLAGVLIDVRGEAGGPMRAVVGVGLNYRLPELAVEKVLAAGGLQPAALVNAEQPAILSRNETAAALVSELQQVLQEFALEGFSALAPTWRDADYLWGKAVTVVTDNGEVSGNVKGIAADGRLQLETKNGIMQFTTGDVSVRAADRLPTDKF